MINFVQFLNCRTLIIKLYCIDIYLDPVLGDANLPRDLLPEEAVGIGVGVEGQFQGILLGL